MKEFLGFRFTIGYVYPLLRFFFSYRFVVFSLFIMEKDRMSDLISEKKGSMTKQRKEKKIFTIRFEAHDEPKNNRPRYLDLMVLWYLTPRFHQGSSSYKSDHVHLLHKSLLWVSIHINPHLKSIADKGFTTMKIFSQNRDLCPIAIISPMAT